MTAIPRQRITGFSNPTVKFLRSLRDKKHRRRERRFLAEGLRLTADWWQTRLSRGAVRTAQTYLA